MSTLDFLREQEARAYAEWLASPPELVTERAIAWHAALRRLDEEVTHRTRLLSRRWEARS